MKHGATRQHAWRFLILAALLGLLSLFVSYPKPAAAERAQPADDAAPAEPIFAAGEAPKITGPYTHGNLAVYLVHAQQRDDRDFITLNEGLKSGKVIVSEKESAEVSELMIENRSDKPLYLQEGDRLVGGKQDRTVHSTIAIAPNSGKMPIPTFCIERSRWSEGAKGGLFAESYNTALATKDVRSAAKLTGSQAQVWDKVQTLKAQSELSLGTANTNSSLNETLDSKQVTKLSKEVADALGNITADHPDAVGVAFAVNGTLEEVNLYPGHTLFTKVYPRLLESYAVEAALNKPKPADDDQDADPKATPKPPTLEAVQAFITATPGERLRKDKINADNQLDIYWSDGKATCITKYNGTTLHRQWLRADKPTDDAQRELRNLNRQQRRQNFEIQNDQEIPQQQQRADEPVNDAENDADE